MLDRVATWHGEQAAVCYQRHLRADNEKQAEADLRDFARHAAIADKLWKNLTAKVFYK